MPTDLPLEPPSELDLAPGQESRFHIGGAGSAGYVWNSTVDGDSDSISVAIEPASAPPPPGATVPRIGSVGHIVIVRALKPGSTRLRLTLARPISSARGPIASFTIVVRVAHP
jgi:predicted secreted protein